jgi:hypothetical protein
MTILFVVAITVQDVYNNPTIAVGLSIVLIIVYLVLGLLPGRRE